MIEKKKKEKYLRKRWRNVRKKRMFQEKRLTWKYDRFISCMNETNNEGLIK